MKPGQPSRTALGAAWHRAAHQVLEHGSVFADPLALRILGLDEAAALSRAEGDEERGRLRLFIAVRSRFAEDALAADLARGVRQVVILGAGLDTFAYRAEVGAGVRLYEVDHPATQAWKRSRLAEAGIPVPEALTFAPVDFERETLGEGLEAAGFEPGQASFFTWLGVVPYLTDQAVFATLAYIARLSGGAQVVFDYANPPEDLDPGGHDLLAARVAAVGEAFRTDFHTEVLHGRLAALGFGEIEDLGPAQIRDRYFPDRHGGPGPDRGGHVVRASVRSHSWADGKATDGVSRIVRRSTGSPHRT